MQHSKVGTRMLALVQKPRFAAHLNIDVVVGHAAPADWDRRQAGVGAVRRGRPHLPPAGAALCGVLLIAGRADDARAGATAGRRRRGRGRPLAAADVDDVPDLGGRHAAALTLADDLVDVRQVSGSGRVGASTERPRAGGRSGCIRDGIAAGGSAGGEQDDDC